MAVTNNLPEMTDIHFHGLNVSPSGISDRSSFGGLAVLLIVDGLTKKPPPELHGIEERTVVLKDFQAVNGAILTENIDSNAPTTRTINGAINPSLGIEAGETQLWRRADIGADVYYQVQLDGHHFHVLAVDGNPVWRVDGKD